jgi:hypothetical protein
MSSVAEQSSISKELKLKLQNNKRYVYITEADELLAAWLHRKEPNRSNCFAFDRVPAKYRLSTPHNKSNSVTQCHVSHNSKTGKMYIKPKSTIDCHGHGRKLSVSTYDLEDFKNAVSQAKAVAPWVSPVLDSATLTRVCRDLGINARAVPKVVDGVQYIAFADRMGMGNMFPGTAFRANSRGIINMAIGKLGIKNMVVSGGFLTFYLVVPLSILKVYLSDGHSMSALVGYLASDLMKLGISSAVGGAVGLATGALTTYICAPVAGAIIFGTGSSLALDYIDNRYGLTDKLVDELEIMSKKANSSAKNTGDVLGRSSDNFFRSQGIKIPRF